MLKFQRRIAWGLGEYEHRDGKRPGSWGRRWPSVQNQGGWGRKKDVERARRPGPCLPMQKGRRERVEEAEEGNRQEGGRLTGPGRGRGGTPSGEALNRTSLSHTACPKTLV